MSEAYPSEAVVEQYIDDVLMEEAPACRWVKCAVERHLDDLANGEERGLWFDPDAAQLVIDFFSLLKHSKGEWAGQTFRLAPWQQFILWVLFGWKRRDGMRRFRTAYIEVARKNGKSTLAAGVGLYLLVADGEPGAEVYSAATKRDQAKIIHDEATRMVKSSPALRKRLTVFKNNIHIKETASKYEPLSADYDTLDGLNIHGAMVDEVHAHPTPDLYEVLETGTSSRRQPLMFAITTAGYDRESLCWQMHEHTEKVLDGVVQDDAWFGVVYTVDDAQQWDDEGEWLKANPNLGVSKYWEVMRDLANRAKEMPARLNVFLRKELNIWTQAESRWINPDHWQACGKAVDADGLRGRTCYGGLDLSSNIDVSALVLVFPPQAEGEDYQVLCRFFLPEEAMLERSRRDRVPYDVWVRAGYIQVTPGNVIDYEWIVAQIDEDMQTYDVQEMAFDRWGATKIATTLQELGGEDFMVKFGQGYVSMSPALRDLEKLILGHKLAHGNNPVLDWMAHNLVVRTDPAGNMKPDKEKSREKIDGMVALAMAIDRAMRHEQTGSVYSRRGIVTI